MLSWESLLSADGVDVTSVACDGTEPSWSAVEPITGSGIVFVRSGLFRREVDGAETVLDAATGYVQRPGSEQRMAHPRGGDLCTSITLGLAQLETLTGGGWSRLRANVADQAVFTAPALDLAHRLLLRHPTAELAFGLVGDVLAGLLPRAVAAGFPARAARRRRAADDIREALADDLTLTLGELAALAGLSPYHLSRVFSRATGQTLTRYKARLRTRRAMESLAAGERDLARLAVETGFADQAHLTRTLRAETGMTPARLRALLG
ncbi:helix-turn-helix domain-containing protein [Flindersiella endophytica]